MAAERETTDRLIAYHLADNIGASFHGRISGVTRSGLFVRLNDTGADGFIPASKIGREYFYYDEKRQSLIGEQSGETHRLGSIVTVRLVEAIPTAGALARFELTSKGTFSKDFDGKSGRRSTLCKGEEKNDLENSAKRKRKIKRANKRASSKNSFHISMALFPGPCHIINRASLSATPTCDKTFLKLDKWAQMNKFSVSNLKVQTMLIR